MKLHELEGGESFSLNGSHFRLIEIKGESAIISNGHRQRIVSKYESVLLDYQKHSVYRISLTVKGKKKRMFQGNQSECADFINTMRYSDRVKYITCKGFPKASDYPS